MVKENNTTAKPRNRTGQFTKTVQTASDGPIPNDQINGDDQDDEDDQRLSRNQQTYGSAEDYAEDARVDDWKEPELLGAPTAREGFVQRYVATHHNGEPTPQNVARQQNKGWKPRAADTVPAGLHTATLSHGQFAGFIGVEGLVLMERPIQLHKVYAKRVKDDTANQMRTINDDLHKVHDPSSGLGAPKVDNSSSVTRGRAVQAAADE